MDLKVKTGCKIKKLKIKLKNESKSARFSVTYDAQEGANGTTINLFEVRLMIKLRVNLITHLELH